MLVIWYLERKVMEKNLSLNNIYLPFSYLERVKRVNEKYTLKVILWDDLPLLLFTFTWQPHYSLLKAISIIFLMISFWCVYEIGYFENDLIAEKYEEKPKLATTYYAHKRMMESYYPWIFSLLFGFLGLFLLEKTQEVRYLFNPALLELKIGAFHPVFLMSFYWILLLISTRLCFWIFNNFNKHTRSWLYILLQSFRYYGFATVTYINPIGTSLLSSNILSRSILYVVYRYSGGEAKDWPTEIPEKVLRCLTFVFILGAISFGSQSLYLWQTWQTWTIICWCLIQGKGQFIRTLSQVKPIFEDGSNYVGTTTIAAR